MLWLAGQEAKPADVQEKEAAAAVKVQAVARGHATRQGTGGSIPRAMGGCRGSGGPAQLAMRAAAAQRKEERKAAQALLGDFVLDTTPQALTPAQQLAKILKRDGARVMDLFKALDANSDGVVTKPELTKALHSLGVKASSAELDGLFANLDPDKSGGIEFRELQVAIFAAMKEQAQPSQLSPPRHPPKSAPAATPGSVAAAHSLSGSAASSVSSTAASVRATSYAMRVFLRVRPPLPREPA